MLISLNDMFIGSIIAGAIVSTLKYIYDKKEIESPSYDKTSKKINIGSTISYIVVGIIFGILIGFLSTGLLQMLLGYSPILDMFIGISPPGIVSICIILGLQDKVYDYFKKREETKIEQLEKTIKRQQELIDSQAEVIAQMRSVDYNEAKEILIKDEQIIRYKQELETQYNKKLTELEAKADELESKINEYESKIAEIETEQSQPEQSGPGVEEMQNEKPEEIQVIEKTVTEDGKSEKIINGTPYDIDTIRNTLLLEGYEAAKVEDALVKANENISCEENIDILKVILS